MTEQELLFSMDIGTRTVVGIVGYHDGQKFKIHACEVEEHKERAMYDGQVHDIELVAQAVKKVTERLEKKLNFPLKRVSIAAAGRTLKTCKVFVERDVDPSVEVDNELVSSLEIEAIQQAQKEIEVMSHEEDVSYFCVGYAVVNQYLNGSIIGNLEGHKAKRAGLEVLATFLPRIVTDSLYAVMVRAGLEVASLTLEPIAAMNVSIQSSLRLLNLALVDIGAGTSDIALTKDGTVFAFAMVPVAGDEITEKIAEVLLLDFSEAEKVKVNLCKKPVVKYKDIMGITYEKSSDEILKGIEPAIKNLAKEISDKIVEYNGKAPSAVFLVGGGSQIPLLTNFIAEYLQIPAERVGIRKTDIIKDVETKGKKLAGPEFITPIGIAVTAYLNRQKDFLHVSVNGVNVKLFNSKTLTVADSLILVGYNPRNLIGRRGSSISFKLNGNNEIVRGEPGEPAQVYLNNQKVGLDKQIANGDVIIVEPAVDGKPAEVRIRDFMNEYPGKIIYMNGKECAVKAAVTVNGDVADVDTLINDGDEIEIKSLNRVLDLVEMFDLNYYDNTISINGKKATLDDSIKNGDQITYEDAAKNAGPAGAEGDGNYNSINIILNGKPVTLKAKKSQFIFVDVFNYVDIDIKNIKGTITVLLNGNKANYTDVINEGDKVEVNWNDR
ncbi:MAG: cell division FtsA domain-containing protein [Caulobacteraceae bacterium]